MSERSPDTRPALPPEAPRPRRWLRWLGWGVALPVAVLVGGGAWLLGTQSGLDASLALAQRATGGALRVDGARGRVLGGVEIDALAYRTPDLYVDLKAVSLAWQPAALFERRLQIDHLTVARVAIAQTVVEDKPDAPPAVAPASLELPFAIEVARLAVGAFAIRDLPAAGAANDPDSAVEAAADVIERAEEAVADPAGAAEAVTDVAAEQGLIFTKLEAALDSDGRHHRLRTLTLELPQGKAHLTLALDGASPFALEGEGGFDGVIETHALALQLKLANTLLEPHLLADAKAEADGLNVRVEAEAASFEPNPLRRLAIKAGELDPAAFVAGAPRAALSLEAELAAPTAHEGLLAGPIRLTNSQPATVDANGIPVLSLAGVLDWRIGEVALDALEIHLPDEGRIAGRVAWRPPQDEDADAPPRAEDAPAPVVAPEAPGAAQAKAATDVGVGQLVAALELVGIDTHQLDTRLPRQIVAGRIDAEADALRQQAQIGLAVGAARIDAEAVVLALSTPALESAGDGAMPAPTRHLTLDARLRGVDPRALLPSAPTGRLSLDLKAEAELPATGLPQAATLDFLIPDSRLEGLPLSGEGRLRLEGQRLPEVRLALRVAGNTLDANGALGAAADSLALRLDAPKLSAIGFGLAGRAGAEGRVGGTLEAPNGQLQFFGEGLRLPGDVRLAGINGSARLDAGMDGPFTLAMGLSGLGPSARGADGKAQPDWLASARLSAEGTRARHQLELSANTPEREGVANTLRLAVQGGVDEGDMPRWTGQLTALETAGRFAARLVAPAALELAADRVRLGAAELNAGDKGRIRLQETAWSPTQTVLRGDLAGLVLDLEPKRRDGRPRRNSDPLTLGARWDLTVGRTLEGEARVFRESGDLSVEGEIRTRLGLEKLEAVLKARGERIDLALDVRGKEFGSVQGEAGLRARRGADGMWGVPPETAISGAARLDMPSITWLGRLARENVETAGRLAGSFNVGGTIAAPRASGRIEGRELVFTLIDQGLILAGGELDLDFDSDRVRLERLEFISPNRVRPREDRIPFDRLTATPGRFTARGEVLLATGNGNFRFDADRLPLLQRDDRWMLLSGEGTARSTWTSLVLDADFRADAGFIEFAESLPPSLSDDVVVLGREEPAAGGAFAVNADVRVSLGDALYLSALGLETRLSGDLRIRLQPGRPLSAVGTVSTVGGGYRGYGQSLVIERGVVNFQGPLDAPGLNIVALRKGLEVEAGVSVTGSAKRPQIRLVSEPNVPDPAKLSWIVLGRAPDAGSGADLGLLLPAAAALLGGPGGGMTEELSRSLGFDSFSFGQGELNSTSRAASSRVLGSGSTIASGPSVSSQVLSLGKRLGPDLFLSFEQSLGGAATLVKLTYQISRRMSVIARGGTDTALDVHYGFSFR
ncbi:translocation/assembly module TamB domain-containing protein [Thauera sp.]|jgi:translocation and assembly module TamB|uniref:translocation/assembly module TamB domain-containing protein n=1 Tax=Thauera sp. TaxID=1905334 RepID=UPI002A369039|nr:translocation/assembly module TamB domain-containing protein [Thauera sp.]MDX9886624.1 translocation/assembly module TamB domain-containing protein [Thauera sp.]